MPPKYNRFRGHDVVNEAICLNVLLINNKKPGAYSIITRKIKKLLLSYHLLLYHLGRIFMSQYAYILVVISLLFLFLVNKYEKEKLQRLLQDQLLKDQDFRATIKEKIQTIENINDVIDYINKGYRLGIPISKEIVDEIRN